MKKKGWSAFFWRKQYVIAGALVVIAAVATTMVYSNHQEQERQRVEAELAEQLEENRSNMVADAEEETEKAAEASAVIPPKSTESSEQAVIKQESTEATETAERQEKDDPNEKKATETASREERLHFSPEDGITWPLEGNVILNYSMDSTVYFPTLDQYKYNPAVIIEGEVNSKVTAAARGQIIAIVNDAVTGCTVTVDMGNGYQAIYGQLKELNFGEGDYVEAGHVIGYVSQPTKYFSEEGSNLYFAMQKDGEPINPIEFLE
ncbi:MAG: peptidoglycan DD-metalloendopeptidase family protein [Roseburia sp.]